MIAAAAAPPTTTMTTTFSHILWCIPCSASQCLTFVKALKCELCVRDAGLMAYWQSSFSSADIFENFINFVCKLHNWITCSSKQDYSLCFVSIFARRKTYINTHTHIKAHTDRWEVSSSKRNRHSRLLENNTLGNPRKWSVLGLDATVVVVVIVDVLVMK